MTTAFQQVEPEIELANCEESRPQGTHFSALLRDIATLGGGTLLATLFNILLIFLIPRLVRVEDYGYWRLFTLYVGYAGFLHLGLADGALLGWAGQPLDGFHHEISPSLKFLCWQHLAMILPASLAFAILFRPDFRFVGIAALVFAMLINAITLLQCALQSARMFAPVAVSTAAPLGIFLALVFLWELRAIPNFRALIVLYFIGWLAILVYLLVRIRTQFGRSPRQHAWKLGSRYILVGWPILLANIGFNLVQSADRLAVSWAATIQGFAQYSLAASSTVTVVLGAVIAAYRAFFPHLAALERERHQRVYAAASRFLLLTWALLLPYYYVLDAFVRRVLPQYVGSLPIAYVLLPGTIFLGEILVLHTSFAYLNGRQAAFLRYTLGALVASFSVVLAAAFGTHSLRAVAAGQVTVLGAWWLFDEWKLRDMTGQTIKEWGPALALFGWAVISYLVAFREAHATLSRISLYYGLLAAALWLVCGPELRLGVRFLTRQRSRAWQA